MTKSWPEVAIDHLDVFKLTGNGHTSTGSDQQLTGSGHMSPWSGQKLTGSGYRSPGCVQVNCKWTYVNWKWPKVDRKWPCHLEVIKKLIRCGYTSTESDNSCEEVTKSWSEMTKSLLKVTGSSHQFNLIEATTVDWKWQEIKVYIQEDTEADRKWTRLYERAQKSTGSDHNLIKTRKWTNIYRH